MVEAQRGAEGEQQVWWFNSIAASTSLATTSLSHHWRRTWFTISILMIAGVIVYVQLSAATAQLLSFGVVERQATAEIVVVDRGFVEGRQRGLRPLQPEALALVAASPDVGANEPLFQRSVRIALPQGEGRRSYLSANVVDPLPPALSAPRSLSGEAKRLLDLPDSLLLTDVDARITGLSLGDEVTFNGRALRVVGLVRGGLAANGSLISKQTVAGLRSPAPEDGRRTPTSVLVKPADGVSTHGLIEKLDAALAPLGAAALGRDELATRISQQILEERTDVRGFLVIAVFMAVVTIVIVLQATNSSIAAQRTEFGILLALGVARWRLAAVILQQTFWLGIISAAFAVSGALVAQVILTQFDVAMTMQAGFIPPVSGLIVGSTVLGGVLALPAALTIKPVELLR